MYIYGLLLSLSLKYQTNNRMFYHKFETDKTDKVTQDPRRTENRNDA